MPESRDAATRASSRCRRPTSSCAASWRSAPTTAAAASTAVARHAAIAAPLTWLRPHAPWRGAPRSRRACRVPSRQVSAEIPLPSPESTTRSSLYPIPCPLRPLTTFSIKLRCRPRRCRAPAPDQRTGPPGRRRMTPKLPRARPISTEVARLGCSVESSSFAAAAGAVHGHVGRGERVEAVQGGPAPAPAERGGPAILGRAGLGSPGPLSSCDAPARQAVILSESA